MQTHRTLVLWKIQVKFKYSSTFTTFRIESTTKETAKEDFINYYITKYPHVPIEEAEVYVEEAEVYVEGDIPCNVIDAVKLQDINY